MDSHLNYYVKSYMAGIGDSTKESLSILHEIYKDDNVKLESKIEEYIVNYTKKYEDW